jgi:Mg-chelatase subunit ChlD
MADEKRTGIQITRAPGQKEVAIVSGGIKIAASQQPIAANFAVKNGWIYVLLDCSGSMRKGLRLDQAKTGIIAFAKDAFKKGYRIGFIRFSDEAEVLGEPTGHLDILQGMIEGLKAVGSTNMTAAIKTAHTKLHDLSGTKVMVIATDGMPDNVKSSLEAAQKAKDEGIDIISIGTDDADQGYLKKLASRTELSSKVPVEKFAQAITDASLLLSTSRSLQTK